MSCSRLRRLLRGPGTGVGARGCSCGAPARLALAVCDPVAGDGFVIDGVAVANFVLPTWFLPGPLPDDVLVDFLGRLADPLTLTPTGCAAFATVPGRWQMWCAKRWTPHRQGTSGFSRLARRIRG